MLSEMIEYTVKVANNGDRAWYLKGKLHREDGPTVEFANGDKVWYLNDKLHREDGPAMDFSDGEKYWYLDGKEYTEQEHKEVTKPRCKVESKVVEIDGIKYELKEVK